MLGGVARSLAALRGLVAGQYLRIALGLAASPILARGLGTHDRGTWALIASFDIASSILLARGMPQAFGYFFVSAETEGGGRLAVVKSANRLLARTSSVALALAFGAGLMLYVTDRVTAGYLAIPLLLATTPLAAVAQLARQHSVMEKKDWRVAVLDGAPAFAQAAAFIGLFAIGRLTLASALATYVVVRLVSGAIGASYWPTFAREDSVAGMSRYGWKALPTTLGQMAQGRVDQVALLGIGREAVGVYSVGALLGNIVNPLYISSSTQLFRSANPRAARKNAVRRVLMIWGIAIGIGLASYIAVPVLYGESYAQAAPVAAMLTFGSVGFGMFLVGRATLDRLGRPEVISSLQMAHLALVAAVLPFVASLYSLLAVAFAAMCLQLVRGTAALTLVRRYGGSTHADHATPDSTTA